MEFTHYCIFSKHLQPLGVEEAAELAAEAGFTGMDLAVRPGGHVEPEDVKTALPEAVRQIKAAGLTCPMMVTNITAPDTPFARDVLETAASLGIKRYRMGYYRYSYEMPIHYEIETIHQGFMQLSLLNEQCGIRGEYQNHGGGMFGSAPMELWYVLKNLPTQWIGCQYDVKHAVMEGGKSWDNTLLFLYNYIGSLDVKDGRWEKQEDGSWYQKSVPMGEGMVDWQRWAELFSLNSSIPLSFHFEFPLPGNPEAGSGQWKQALLKVMKRELAVFKTIAQPE